MSQSQNLCPVCNHLVTEVVYSLKKGQLEHCNHCDLIIFTPRPTPEELKAFYESEEYREDYQKSPMTGENFAQQRYDQLIQVIAKSVPHVLTSKDKSLLDVGCGVGDLLKIASQNGWHVTGTEISEAATETANQTLENTVINGDILSLDLPLNSYDLITCYHVIEHLLDPIATLNKMLTLLKPNGIAFIETPNIGSLGAKIKGKNWSHITPPEHITYFNPSSLKYALEKAGFGKSKVFTIAPPVVKSVSNWSKLTKEAAMLVYRFAPIFNLGATLQGVAFK